MERVINGVFDIKDPSLQVKRSMPAFGVSDFFGVTRSCLPQSCDNGAAIATG